MTIFAGAYSLNPNEHLPTELLDQLRSAVSRSPLDTPHEHVSPGFFALNVDLHAFGAAGDKTDTANNVTIVAGEPLLSDGEGNPEWRRATDVDVLHREFSGGSSAGLRRARGTFCGLHYQAAQHRLTLFVDKIGVRPLYVWTGPRFVVFSTALRILEAVPAVHKLFDLRGVTEVAAFGFALADRTPYRGIHMLRSGEALTVAAGKVERALYWRWDGPLDTSVDYTQGVKRSYKEFIKAIDRRHRSSSIAAAFLSGGLDSRVIVGGLVANGSKVYTVNYAPDGSQDQVFAKLVADKLDIDYTQIETNLKNVSQNYRKDAVAGWIKGTFADSTQNGRTPLIWSGDGGSVGLGNVYMTPEIVDAMERGDTARAIALFHKKSVPAGILKRSVRAELQRLPFQGIEEELAAIDSPDAGRKFHLFLMFNDQRRHLAQHFEDIDVERIEFQLPFFDADFLESVLRLPNDWFMAHRFYMNWLAEFPNGLNTIPWQAYPGHIPCTLPSPPDLKYQWGEFYDKEIYAQLRSAAAARARAMLAAPRFPDHLISRNTLRVATLLTGTGLRNYGYLIKTAGIFQRYWQATNDVATAA
ncbi:MAG: asparagine synthase [Massilia sp.]|nr:asparagine synthase [Massilia sp.]